MYTPCIHTLTHAHTYTRVRAPTHKHMHRPDATLTPQAVRHVKVQSTHYECTIRHSYEIATYTTALTPMLGYTCILRSVYIAHALCIDTRVTTSTLPRGTKQSRAPRYHYHVEPYTDILGGSVIGAIIYEAQRRIQSHFILCSAHNVCVTQRHSPTLCPTVTLCTQGQPFDAVAKECREVSSLMGYECSTRGTAYMEQSPCIIPSARSWYHSKRIGSTHAPQACRGVPLCSLTPGESGCNP